MNLCTLVSETAWLSMLERGYLVCDDMSMATISDWLFAYEWMMEQMTQRIGPPSPDVKLPLWAWYRYYGGKRKPFTSGWREEKGHKIYRLDFEADAAQVLVSDFTDWHCVLNNSYLGVSLADYDAYEAAFDLPDLSPALEAKAKAIKRKSWETIFDLELVKVFGERVEKRECIQACLWRIELSQINKVQAYISTGYKWRTIQPRFRCLHDKIQPPFNR